MPVVDGTGIGQVRLGVLADIVGCDGEGREPVAARWMEDSPHQPRPHRRAQDEDEDGADGEGLDDTPQRHDPLSNSSPALASGVVVTVTRCVGQYAPGSRIGLSGWEGQLSMSMYLISVLTETKTTG